MKTLFLALLISGAASAQNLTTVTSVNIQRGGALLPSGRICFQATDSNDNNIGFRVGGGGQAVVSPYCAQLSNGAIVGTLNVANPANTAPVNINYRIQIFGNSSGPLLTYSGVQFSGPTFNFDQYVPSANLPLGASAPFLTIGTGFINNFLDVTEIASPGNPVAGERWYADLNTHKLSCLTSAGANCNPGGGGGGSSSWDAITAPVANQALTMLHFTTTWTYDATTGASTNMFVITDTTNNTGTGYLNLIKTAPGSAAKPVGFCVKGTTDCVEMTSTAVFHPIGAAHINADQMNGVAMLSTGSGTLGRIPIDQGNGTSVWADPLVQGTQADLTTGIANPVAIGGYDLAGTPVLHRAIELNSNPAGTEYGIVTRPIPSGVQPISATALPLPTGAAQDASVTGLEVAQASTTSGQKGILGLGAVTTAAPSYTTAQTSPLSLDLTGNLRTAVTNTVAQNQTQINGSAVVTSATGVQKVGVVGNAGAVLDFAGQNAASPANALLAGCQFNTTPTTITTGNASPCQLDAAGNLKVNIIAGGGTGGGPADVGLTTAASETDAARQKVTSALRLLDTSQSAGSQLVGAKGDQTSGMWVNCKSGCAAAGDQSTGSTALGSNGAAIVLPLTGENKATFQLQSGGTGVYTVTPQCSFDNGTLYNVNGVIQDPLSGQISTTAVIASAQVTTDYPVLCPQGASNVQMKVTAYTSGTANWVARATVNSGPNLTFGAVQTAAPSPANNTFNPLSLTTAGALRTDSSAVTQPVNVTQYGGTSTTLGQKAMTASIPVVPASDYVPSDTVGTLGALNGSNAAASVATNGQLGVSVIIAAGTLAGTITPEISNDGGTNWTATYFALPSGQIVPTRVYSNPNAVDQLTVIVPPGASNARVRVSSFTSGTANATLRASEIDTGSPVLYAGPANTIAPPLADQIGGSDGTNIQALRAANTTPGGSEFGLITRNIPSGTQAISAASLPLPSGASTSAKQPALGTAGSASADVITIQGIASMTAVKVDGSGVTQPVSGSITATQATGTNLHMVCDSGCSGSAGFADSAAFTVGTTAINPVGGLFDDTPPTAITTGKAASARITNNRALHINLRNQAGTEIGTSGAPVRTDPTGTTTQPISAASLPLPTGAALDASVTGLEVAQGSATSGQKGVLDLCAVTTAAPSYTTAQSSPCSLDTAGNLRTSVLNTVTVSGTVTTTPPANASTNVTQFGSTNVSTGTGTGGAGIPRVTVSSDSSLTANIGTTGGLALDATLTGGTAKDIVRGGTKGSTSPADITSTASGANHQPVDVAIYDASGNQITSFGGGTQYAENTTQATATGTVALGKNASNVVFPLQLDANKNLAVGGGSANGTLLSGSENPVLLAGSDQGWGPGVSPGAAPTKRAEYVDIYGRAHVVCDGGCSSSVTINAGLARQLPALPISGSLGQPITSTGQALDVNVKYPPASGDGCNGTKKANAAISQIASAQIIPAGPSGTRILVCEIFVYGSDAENVSLVEGTGVTCGTSTLAIIGGTTAANGPNMPAGGGFAPGTGSGTIASSNVPGNNVCLLQSGSGRVAGNVSYVYGQ